MHPRLFQLAGRLPVGGARRGLHQHKGFTALQAAHHVVVHGGIAGQLRFVFLLVPHRVAVPGDEVDRFRQLPVVVIVEILHEVGRHRQFGIGGLQRRHLMPAKIGDLRGIEAAPVEIQAVNRDFPLRRGGFNLRPVGVGVAPEGAPPRMVQRVEGFVARL